MKTGEAYWNSRQQRMFDMSIAAPMLPAFKLAKNILARSVEDSDLDTVFLQQRVGRLIDGDRIFTIEKLRTLDDDKQPISTLTARFRKLGIDELAQLGNIYRGEMSICGYRPLIPKGTGGLTSYEAVMDNLPTALGNRWQAITESCNPGIVSTYGIHQHTRTQVDPNEYEIRAEMDIQDAMEASLTLNMALLRRFAATALARRLQ